MFSFANNFVYIFQLLYDANLNSLFFFWKTYRAFAVIIDFFLVFLQFFLCLSFVNHGYGRSFKAFF